MRTFFRVITTVVALVLVLVIAAVLVVALYFDPNDFKDELAEAVQKETGRTLDISGNIELSLFPWLGVDVGRLEVGNAPGFEDSPFASADRMQVRVRLLPLLKKQLEMDTVTLHGLDLRLARDQQGRGNWEDLAQPQDAKPEKKEPKETQGLPLAGLAIGGLDVQQARIEWDDAQAGQRYALDGVSLQTKAIVAGQPIEFSLEFRLELEEPDLNGDVALKGGVEFDLERQRYRMRNLVMTSAFKGAALPGEVVDMSLKTQADLDLMAQTLNLPELTLKLVGVDMRGAVSADRVLDAPQFNASFKVARFNLKELLERLGQPPVVTTDPKALTRVSLDGRLTGATNQVAVERLTIGVDDTTLEGQVRIPHFDGPAVRFDLTVDAIDADRYLPPAAEGTAPPAATPGAATAAGAVGESPLPALRALDLEGQLKIGSLKISNLRISDVLLRLTGTDGLIQLHPAEAQLYDGDYRGNIRLDARQDQLKFSMNEKLTAVHAGPLLKDLLGKERLLGRADAQAKLTTRGNDADAMRRSLTGQAAFSFVDGAVKGINIGRLIREAKARLDGKPLPPSKEPLQTDFTELAGTINVKDGVARNDDLQAKSPLFRINGKGTADLVKEQVDYRLTTAIVKTEEGQGGKELADLEGILIPIQITGSFQDPQFNLDLKTLLAERSKQKAQKKLEKKIDEKLDEKYREPAKELLRDLFR